MGTFLFSDDDIFKKIKFLSGGEKSRVALARVIMKKANFIILDEPTNHLDFQSKEILQKALRQFDGTIILVSHDIAFLRPIVNKVLELRPHKHKLYYGGIDYYLEKIEAEDVGTDETVNSNKKEGSKRKDKKRIEAELRSKRYELTKNLKLEVESLEVSIEKMEKRKDRVESELVDENIFDKPDLLREKTAEYETLKSELSEAYKSWEEKSAALEEIEKEFNNKLSRELLG
jgi:ATP-binding cassette subfamily F protein 3